MKKFVLLTLLLIIFLTACTSNNSKTTTSSNNLDNADHIKIPISSISDKMSKYTFDANGVGVNYIVVIGSDGNIRTAFDACDVCGGTKGGYRQEGEDVVCNNCGRHFKIDELGVNNVGGGCWPSDLNFKQNGESIYISKKELESGRYRFA